MIQNNLNISDFDYPLTDDRIAKFPLEERDASKLLGCSACGELSENRFRDLPTLLPDSATLVFNNTKVIRARLVFFKESGARVEIFCLEPHAPADYERAMAALGESRWCCIVGNLKRWKSGLLTVEFPYEKTTGHLTAEIEQRGETNHIVRFSWDVALTFGEILEHLGQIPIPPYLNRDSQEIDNTRYQTVYCKFEGSVAAPTAGLHFTPNVMEQLAQRGVDLEYVTLHVGAGTFIPVKSENALEHPMHAEHFTVTLATLERLTQAHTVVAVGTTSVRTLESITVLAYRVMHEGDPQSDRVIGQWEAYDIPTELKRRDLFGALAVWMRENGITSLSAATRIMIVPGYQFRIIDGIITNFHQPKSTLLLLISALVGETWHSIYRYALDHEFRFLSYGDSSLLWKKQ